MITLYKILLFVTEGCLQCQYVKEKIKSLRLEGITVLDVTDKENEELCNQYGGQRVPYVVIKRNERVIAKKVIDNPADINWLTEYFV